MKLQELLSYDDIVIQCHDRPDADTIASGYVLLKYLEKMGKSPRLVYSGQQELTRGSLVEMKKIFGIPLTYLSKPDGEAELLITVDCRAGERNVTALPFRNLAVIDHHTVKAEEVLPPLSEVRTESDGYASCATVLWAMLKEAGFPVETDSQIPTLLYYGLYMDTQELKNARKMDREMLEELKYDMDIVSQLQSISLSLEELYIIGRAYGNLHIHPEHQFVVAQVEPCDPDLLGIIGDELMKVAGVNASVTYCMLNGDQGAQVSVRCRKNIWNAVDLVGWLVRNMGNDGGGTPTKAAGRIPKAFLEKACTKDHWDDLSGAVGRLFYQQLTDYFKAPPCQIRTEEYSREKMQEFCSSALSLYRKEKIPVGYVRSTDLFPEGKEFLLRMLEGDARRTATPDLYIMIGVDGETYYNREINLRKKYDLTDEPFTMDSGSPWQPKIYSFSDQKAVSLLPYAKKCVAKDSAKIWAAQLNCRIRVITKEGVIRWGDAGDWLASEVERQNMYIIRNSIFAKTYKKAED